MLNNFKCYKFKCSNNLGIFFALFSDKWFVQSGIVSCTHNVSVTVNLFKNYKDTNYTGFCCPLRQAQDIWGHGDTITERNIDSFKLYVNNSVGNYDESWITYGYSP